MSLERDIADFHEIRQKIQELEEQKKALGVRIMEQMPSKKMQVGTFRVQRYDCLSIKTPIEIARSLDAVMIKETIDRDKIKALYNQGQPVEGVSETHYIQVNEYPRNPSG